ncbi:MAG: glycerol kinase GlpK [Bacteriovoracales bacterium]|nr:glycerol kinase GlpK [Bacteriovoracales bacterium]
MSKFILAIDQGTTGTTACLTDLSTLRFLGKVGLEFPQIFPRPGWVEHDLGDIWHCTEKVVRELLKNHGVASRDIACIGITNQRETVGAFTREGVPLGHAIVWQDRRTGEFCEELKSSKAAKDITRKTGLAIDSYFSGSKIKWLLENDTRVQKAKEKGDLLFGTIDTFLLYKLSGGKAYKTEGSNASRTMLYDIEKGKWDRDFLDIFCVGEDELPEVCDSFTLFGKTEGLSFLPDGIPITGILGDQQAALFGQGGVGEGEMKCTYGTGGFLLLNTGTKKIDSQNGLLSTVAYRHEGQNRFALEGSCYVAGAAVQWLRDKLGFFESSKQIEELSKGVQDILEMEFVTFLPFFTGTASPYWCSEAKAAIVGLTRDTGKPHIARACLDGVALSIEDVISTFKKDLDQEIPALKVDGGMCQNDLFCQIQANVSEIIIKRPQVIETTSYGACLAAAIGLGEKTFQDVENSSSTYEEFAPNDEKDFYRKKKLLWDGLIQRLYLSK